MFPPQNGRSNLDWCGRYGTKTCATRRSQQAEVSSLGALYCVPLVGLCSIIPIKHQHTEKPVNLNADAVETL